MISACAQNVYERRDNIVTEGAEHLQSGSMWVDQPSRSAVASIRTVQPPKTASGQRFFGRA
jgi:hypothetical protein